MKTITIDRNVRLAEDPGTGHNRWHPAISPVAEVEPGEEIAVQTRDALDGQLSPSSTEVDLARTSLNPVHPLTGPIYIKGARAGDLLEIEFIDIVPEPWAFTSVAPGAGFLGDLPEKPLLVHWIIDGDWARSPQLPGFRLPGAPFMGVSGVAPAQREIEQWSAREQTYAKGGGLAFLPDVAGAVPGLGPASKEGLRTMPPRENGGNFDVKQLTKGSKLYLPVSVDGALFSTGDAHYAQGDGEVCLTAAEMGATTVLRFRVLKGRGSASPHGIRFEHSGLFADPRHTTPANYVATMGMPITDGGVNEGENLNLAARNALLAMVDVLQEHNYSREQAYAICSVAVDLKVSQVVDVPNYVVSAFLSRDLLTD